MTDPYRQAWRIDVAGFILRMCGVWKVVEVFCWIVDFSIKRIMP